MVLISDPPQNRADLSSYQKAACLLDNIPYEQLVSGSAGETRGGGGAVLPCISYIGATPKGMVFEPLWYEIEYGFHENF